jgi:hypothetical protein
MTTVTYTAIFSCKSFLFRPSLLLSTAYTKDSSHVKTLAVATTSLNDQSDQGQTRN